MLRARMLRSTLGLGCFIRQAPACVMPVRFHGHHHHHRHHDEARKEGSHATWLGLASNVFLTTTKGAAGIMYGSTALIADAVHSLADLASDVVTLYTFHKSNQGADERFPYGYGKFEPLGSLAVSTLLIAGGGGMAWHSLELLMHSGGIGEAMPLGIGALWAALGIVVAKEGLFQWTLRIGRRLNSPVLVANAWHHRSDALSTLVALGGILGAQMGYAWFDPLGGLVVAGMITHAGYQSTMSACSELLDMRQSSQLHDQVAAKVQSIISNVKSTVTCFRLRLRKMGTYWIVDIELDASHCEQIAPLHTIQHVIAQLQKDLRSEQFREVNVSLKV